MGNVLYVRGQSITRLRCPRAMCSATNAYMIRWRRTVDVPLLYYQLGFGSCAKYWCNYCIFYYNQRSSRTCISGNKSGHEPYLSFPAPSRVTSDILSDQETICCAFVIRHEGKSLDARVDNAVHTVLLSSANTSKLNKFQDGPSTTSITSFSKKSSLLWLRIGLAPRLQLWHSGSVR